MNIQTARVETKKKSRKLQVVTKENQNNEKTKLQDMDCKAQRKLL